MIPEEKIKNVLNLKKAGMNEETACKLCGVDYEEFKRQTKGSGFLDWFQDIVSGKEKPKS